MHYIIQNTIIPFIHWWFMRRCWLLGLSYGNLVCVLQSRIAGSAFRMTSRKLGQYAPLLQVIGSCCGLAIAIFDDARSYSPCSKVRLSSETFVWLARRTHVGQVDHRRWIFASSKYFLARPFLKQLYPETGVDGFPQQILFSIGAGTITSSQSSNLIMWIARLFLSTFWAQDDQFIFP